MTETLTTHARTPAMIVVLGMIIGAAACAPQAPATPPRAVPSNADAQAVRTARAAQNRAIAAGDIDSIAAFWTDDVEIRRGLGQLIVGRSAYRQLWVPTDDPDAALIYQRVPETVSVSSRWPLAYESGTWAGHLGRVNGPAVIGGSYAAQWVKRNGRWLIRGEVYVALACEAQGCAFASAP